MLEISSVGAKVSYGVETTAGTQPTTWVEIPDVSEAPEVSLATESLDASNITDYITRYIPGRQDPGGEKTFTLNHTDAVITAWATFVSAAETAKAGGKATWIKYEYPEATKAFYWKGEPKALGNNGIQQNQVSTIPGTVICNGVEGWQ